MNHSISTCAIMAGLAIVACTSPAPAPTRVAPEAGTQAPEVTYAIDPALSGVDWSGTMIGMVTHSGTVRFASGTLITKGGMLTGGDFTVDMRSVDPTDTSYAKPGATQGTETMFMGHLMSPDFFAVDSFPTARFKVTSVEDNTASGELTVRGKTHSEQVKDIVISSVSAGVKATGTLTFNRQDFGVAWSSPVKDMVLSNDVVLTVDMTGTVK